MILNIFHLLFIFIFFGILALTVYYITTYNFKKSPQIDTLYTDALNSMVKGDNLKAINILKQVVKQDSNHVRAYLQLGNILQNDKPEQAIKIHQSLTVRPNLPSDLQLDIHRALATDYSIIGDNKNATKEAQKILTLEKRNLWALMFLIKISEQDHNWDQAAFWTKKLRKVSGRKNINDEAKFDVYRGLDCLKNGLIDEAKKLFQKSIKVSPSYGPSYRYLGDTYEKTRDLVKAVENWKIFAEKDIENGQSIYGKIESALFDLGRYSEVEKFYRKILDLDSSNFEAIIRLANVLEEKGESGAALTLVENAIDPENQDVRADIMKLKLSILTSTPVDLSHQIGQSIVKTQAVIFFDEDVPGGGTAYMMQEVLEKQQAYDSLDAPPRTLSAKAHRSAYGSDGDYYSKPNCDDLIELAYDIMHERNPHAFPK